MYCSKCGEKLSKKEIQNEGTIPNCIKCNELYFPKSSIATIVVLTNKNDEICLLKQKSVYDDYVLIAGYHRPGESLEDTAIRETYEEVGIRINETFYINSYYYDKKDIIMIAYHGRCKQRELKIQESEVARAIWVPKEDALDLVRKGLVGFKVLDEFLK